jgi:hypothetical protein
MELEICKLDDLHEKGRDTQTCDIVWNIERDQSFWITSSEYQGTMPKGIISLWILNNEDPTILRYLCQYVLSTTI